MSESCVRSVLGRASDIHRHAMRLAHHHEPQPGDARRTYDDLFGLSQRLPELCFLLRVKPVQVWQRHLTKLRRQVTLP